LSKTGGSQAEQDDQTHRRIAYELVHGFNLLFEKWCGVNELTAIGGLSVCGWQRQ
jgi:hypothetical protein